MVTINDAPVDEKAKVGTLRIGVDPIHGGLRMAVFGSFLGAGALTFGAGILLIPNGLGLAILLSMASAAGASMGIERLLKDKWLSGREFVADSDRIALTKHSKIESVIDAQQQINVLAWRFDIKKDSPRAKKGWQLLGLGLEQDDNFVVVYTAASPEDFENMPLSKQFIKLEKQKKDDKKSTLSSASGMRMAGEQKRLYEGEVIRQIIGGDMLFEDFTETLEFLQTNYPRWMISD